jgi:PEGA domain
MPRFIQKTALGFSLLLGLGGALGCATMGLRAAVSMKVEKTADTPRDALVYIDGQYVAPLGTVVKRGVRVPEGEHRVSVEKNGYYPFDAIIVSRREPIFLKVELVELPD